jgi:hypothetical protein
MQAAGITFPIFAKNNSPRTSFFRFSKVRRESPFSLFLFTATPDQSLLFSFCD